MYEIVEKPMSLLGALLEFFPAEVRGEIEGGLPRLAIDAQRLGLEVLVAEEDGLSFADAARQQGRYPLMARAHYGVLDLLQTELPKPLVEIIAVVFEQMRAAPGLKDWTRRVFEVAGGPDAGGALLRFLIYEGVRLNFWLLTWDQPDIEAAGTFCEFDAQAERVLKEHLRCPPYGDQEVRPMSVLIAELMVWLRDHCALREQEIRQLLAAVTAHAI